MTQKQLRHMKTPTEKYTTEHLGDGVYVRKMLDGSGREWTWKSLSDFRKKSTFSASNGVTMKMLQEAGHSVRVKHLRWAIYMGLGERTAGRSAKAQKVLRAIVVPSTFRKDPMYTLLPKGGFTHISIKTPEGKYICLSSECSDNDPFCYQQGMAKALERLSRYDINLLKLPV